MSRSSIFSFSTLRPRGLRPWGALVAGGLLLLVEVGVARRDWVWDAVPASDVGLMSLLESRVIAPAPAPTVLLLGSSRIRDGVLPRRLEARMGLPAGSVLNLGLTGGNPHDALTLYRRHRAKFARARYLVMSAEDWYLNASIAPDERDRRYATLLERLTDYDGQYRLSLLVGWLWRTYDARDAIRRVVRCLRDPCPARALLSADGRVIFRRSELETGPLDADVSANVSGFYADYRPGTTRLKQLRRLVALARADGLRVVVIQFPLRDAYLAEVERRFPAAYAHYKRALCGLRGADVLIYEAGSETGFAADDFYDYGHLTLRGARLMTDRLAALLAGTGPSDQAGMCRTTTQSPAWGGTSNGRSSSTLSRAKSISTTSRDSPRTSTVSPGSTPARCRCTVRGSEGNARYTPATITAKQR